MIGKLRGTAAVISAVSALSALSPYVCAGTVHAVGGVQAVYYVSPEGSDSGDGSLDSPFATLERARDEVRKVNGSMTGDIVVYLRGGDYRITEPVEFDTRDSGTGGLQGQI
ncbi:hypothetical protein [Ruminococcus sp.]|uniref:right-handed parallel beta-helix repeat-containing protein n=1 Tax=Ruminococcus sp. TaxID=41978 RepID=UPI002CA06A80|nr:hypothetical protein [Ruminococcus sp.]HNZ99857.1 hypothetical protein [Ruminococcus sp.]HOH88105.1 hypothetical protein [Ruminococcus sp.]